MYLLPTEQELNKLWQKINPTAQIIEFLYSRPPAKDSMAEFFFESEDIELVMEDDAMSFDEIEDDILNMRRDINGFRCPEFARGTDTVNFKGCTFEIIDEYKGVDLGKKVTWEEI